MSLYDDHSPFVGTLGLIRRYEEASVFWLVVDDSERNIVRLPEVRRGEDGSFRNALISHIESQLKLSRKSHFIVSGHARSHHQAPIQWPGTENVMWVIVQFIVTDLYGSTAEQILADRADVRWASMQEIAAGQLSTGHQFCPRQMHLIERADILPASETR